MLGLLYGSTGLFGFHFRNLAAYSYGCWACFTEVLTCLASTSVILLFIPRDAGSIYGSTGLFGFYFRNLATYLLKTLSLQSLQILSNLRNLAIRIEQLCELLAGNRLFQEVLINLF